MTDIQAEIKSLKNKDELTKLNEELRLINIQIKIISDKLEKL